jgi:hypothetical protein
VKEYCEMQNYLGKVPKGIFTKIFPTSANNSEQ